jgi:SPX domain protein involved in polyphosphate accumulation
MRFGGTLRASIYPPWKEHYVEYDKLKRLLKENDDDDTWTAEDESAFVDELMNNQLQKVHKFQSETSQTLRDRTTACEKKLEPLAVGLKGEEGQDSQEAKDSEASPAGVNANADGNVNGKQKAQPAGEERQKLLKEVLAELDTITKEVNELEKFSRINYTAFFKATKKHDRKRGQDYRLRPYLETRLAAHPLNTEDYSPLLFRLSAMYSFVRQSLEGKTQETLSFAEGSTSGESFTSHKCMS